MKSIENPEFILIKKVRQLRDKYENIPEIVELEEEIREIINQNCISSVQMAMLYLLGSRENLDAETSKKIASIMRGVLDESQ